MKTNLAGLELIKEQEALRLKPYQDINGFWTEGYGHTKGVTRNSCAITSEQALEWLKEDVMESEHWIEKYIHVPLTNNQFSALASLVFNCGPAPLLATLGAYLNAKNYVKAADAFLPWDHITRNGEKIVVAGLVKRRQAERALFLKED